MFTLALWVTVPVFLGIVAAGFFGIRSGSGVLWTVLAISCLAAAIAWGINEDGGPFVQRFIAPLVFYVPPMALAGTALALLGRPKWNTRTVLPIALLAAVANIFLAQWSFVMGCAAGLWECS